MKAKGWITIIFARQVLSIDGVDEIPEDLEFRVDAPVEHSQEPYLCAAELARRAGLYLGPHWYVDSVEWRRNPEFEVP